MHLLESYALNCGSKIKAPQIYTTFFPLPITNFITFHSDEAEAAKNYSYWQDVINLLNPIMKQLDIQIVQIGDVNHREFNDCLSFRGQMSHNQQAYVIQRSILHFGPDGFLLQLAGAANIPLVGLYSSNYVGSTKPYFGDPSRQILFNAYERAKLKPSQSAEEFPKTIDLIRPEEIAAAVLKLLNINFEFPFETVYTGKKYSHFVIQEAIPDSEVLVFNPEIPVEIRADLGYNEESFFLHLANYKKSVVVLDKPINLNFLRRFKDNIQSIIFKITGPDQGDFLQEIVSLGKNLILVSDLPKEEVDKLRIEYYTFGNIHILDKESEDKINELKKDIDRLYYRSAKVTSSGGKYYYSQASIETQSPMANHHEYQKVIDSPLFWKNIHCFTIVRKK